MANLTEKLSRFVAELRHEDIPANAVENAKILLGDYFAAASAGYRLNRKFNGAVENVYFSMDGAPESTAFFSGRKLPAMNAAFINAVYAHGAELDDGHRLAMGHPAAPVLSALLPLAEKLHVSGKELLTAMAAGYEVYVRVASAVQPAHVNRGFHSTGTVGTMGAAAACAKLLGLDAQGIENAISLAIVQNGGLIIVNESGQSCKPINPARAASCGVLAAYLAKEGIEAPHNALESSKGFFHAFSDGFDAKPLENLSTDHLALAECYIKPYPSCRHTHAGVDAALALRERVGELSQIEKIEVRIYPVAISLAGKISQPKTAGEAKFSIAYALCCALANGSFGISDLDNPANCSDVVKSLTQKVEIICDQSTEDPQKGTRGIIVTVMEENGERHVQEISLPKGDPENPFGRADIKNKLNWCAGELLNSTRQKELCEMVFAAEELPDTAKLMEFMS